MVDITDLAGDVVRGVRTTSVDPVVVQSEKNRVATLAAEAESAIAPQRKDAAMRAAALVGEQSISAAELAQMEARKLADVLQATEKEVGDSLIGRERAERAYEKRLGEHRELAETANHSFFRNPFTYVRDQYRLNVKEQEITGLVQNIEATNVHIDNQFMQAAHEVQRFQQSTTASMAADNNLAFQTTRAELLKKNAEIAAAEATATKGQQLAQSKGAVSEYERQSSEQKEALSLKYLFGVLNNFDYTHFGEPAKKEMLRLYTNMPPAERRQLELNTARWFPHDMQGTGITLQEHMVDLAEKNDADGWFLASTLSGDRTALRVAEIGQNALYKDTEATVRANFQIEFADELALTGGKLTAQQERMIRERTTAQVGQIGGVDVLAKSVDVVVADGATALANNRTFMASAGTPELLQSAGAPEAVVAWASTEAAREALDLPHLEFGDPVTGASYAAYKSMLNAGISPAEAAQGIATLVRERGFGEYARSGVYGAEAQRLQNLGYGDRVKPKIFTTLREDQLTKGLAPSTLGGFVASPGELARASRATEAAQGLTREPLDMTNPQDIQNLMARLEKFTLLRSEVSRPR